MAVPDQPGPAPEHAEAPEITPTRNTVVGATGSRERNVM